MSSTLGTPAQGPRCYPTWIPAAKAEHRWHPPFPGWDGQPRCFLYFQPIWGLPDTCCFKALCGGSSTYLDGLQGVIQLPPLCWLLPLHAEAIVVDAKVEVHLHEAEVVMLVVQAQLVET